MARARVWIEPPTSVREAIKQTTRSPWRWKQINSITSSIFWNQASFCLRKRNDQKRSNWTSKKTVYYASYTIKKFVSICYFVCQTKITTNRTFPLVVQFSHSSDDTSLLKFDNSYHYRFLIIRWSTKYMSHISLSNWWSEYNDKDGKFFVSKTFLLLPKLIRFFDFNFTFDIFCNYLFKLLITHSICVCLCVCVMSMSIIISY